MGSSSFPTTITTTTTTTITTKLHVTWHVFVIISLPCSPREDVLAYNM
jgi:hypothetical protein